MLKPKNSIGDTLRENAFWLQVGGASLTALSLSMLFAAEVMRRTAEPAAQASLAVCQPVTLPAPGRLPKLGD